MLPLEQSFWTSPSDVLYILQTRIIRSFISLVEKESIIRKHVSTKLLKEVEIAQVE